MAYENYNRKSYGGNNYGRSGSYNSKRTDSGYHRNEQQQDKSFGSRFRIRGIVCTNKSTGEGFSRINTRNGSSMCSVNVMVKRFKNSGNRDDSGRTIWNEEADYFRLVAFGENADIVMRMVKAKSVMDFSGEIRVQEDNGAYSYTFIIDKVEMIREYSGNSNSRDKQQYQPARQQKRQEFNYEDRPNNRYDREHNNSSKYSQPNPQQNNQNNYKEEDVEYAESSDEDIPF